MRFNGFRLCVVSMFRTILYVFGYCTPPCGAPLTSDRHWRSHTPVRRSRPAQKKNKQNKKKLYLMAYTTPVIEAFFCWPRLFRLLIQHGNLFFLIIDGWRNFCAYRIDMDIINTHTHDVSDRSIHKLWDDEALADFCNDYCLKPA